MLKAMSLDNEIRMIKAKRKLALTIPVMTAGVGGGFGILGKNAVNYYNNELDNLEHNVQAILTYYRAREKAIEQEIDSIPGLSTWKNAYEKIFGETQEATGLREVISADSTQTLAQVNPEDLSLQGMKLPDNYDLPLLGLAIGFVYGITKLAGKLSQLNREQKIFEAIRR